MNVRYRDSGLFVLTSVLFGGTFAAIKSGLTVIPPVLFAAFRFDIGASILFAYLFVRGTDWRPRTRGDWEAVLASTVLIVVVNNVLLFLGQQHTSSAIAAVMYSFSPVLAPAFAVALLVDERLTGEGIFGLVVAFVGIAVIAQPDPANLLGNNADGTVLILIAAAGVALGGVLVRRSRPSMSSLGMTAWAMLIGALSIHVVSAALGEPFSIPWTPVSVLSVVYMGVLATAIAYAAYFELLDQVGVITVNLTTYVVPLVAATVGWVLLGEAITGTMMIGFAFIVAGFYLLKRDVISAELRRLQITIPQLTSRQSNSTTTRTPQYHYDGGVQAHDRNNCDD